MLDMSVPLGRDVATPQQVLEVIRPELRIWAAMSVGVVESIRAGWLYGTPDMELGDSADDGVHDAMFAAIRARALASVGEWAHDMGLVFDKERTGEFIRQALIHVYSNIDQLPGGLKALDY